jgi:hypothetical protein
MPHCFACIQYQIYLLLFFAKGKCKYYFIIFALAIILPHRRYKV